MTDNLTVIILKEKLFIKIFQQLKIVELTKSHLLKSFINSVKKMSNLGG